MLTFFPCRFFVLRWSFALSQPLADRRKSLCHDPSAHQEKMMTVMMTVMVVVMIVVMVLIMMVTKMVTKMVMVMVMVV